MPSLKARILMVKNEKIEAENQEENLDENPTTEAPSRVI